MKGKCGYTGQHPRRRKKGFSGAGEARTSTVTVTYRFISPREAYDNYRHAPRWHEAGWHNFFHTLLYAVFSITVQSASGLTRETAPVPRTGWLSPTASSMIWRACQQTAVKRSQKLFRHTRRNRQCNMTMLQCLVDAAALSLNQLSLTPASEALPVVIPRRRNRRSRA